MHFLPILSTLKRHRTAATLIILEIALTCAIVCNAVFLISDRVSRMGRPSGVVEDELIRLQITGIGKGADTVSITQQDVAAMRAIPGVKSVSPANMIPFGGSSWNTSVSTISDDPSPPINSGQYMGGPALMDTFGVQLIAGRTYTADEYVDWKTYQLPSYKIPSIVVTKGQADRLFPGQNAVGKQIYFGKDPATIIGVIERIARPNQVSGRAGQDFAMFMPATIPYDIGGNYVLRVDPARKAEILAAADAALMKVDPNRIVLKKDTFGEIRREFFKQDRAMAWLLVGVCIALLVITALGVIGLASFWVQQRRRQIGIRRALGATRTDILRYFQVENFILATLGIIVGMGMAYGINLWLMGKYEVPRLPAEYLPLGALVLWGIGQIAVLGPALRASLIPPAVATRSV